MPQFKVKVKWDRQLFSDIDLNTDHSPSVFKKHLFKLTGVPPDRQKLLVKGIVVKDSWDDKALHPNCLLLLLGSKDVLPVEPIAKTVFLEDMTESEISKASNLPPGLNNLGNTCYINATIQCLRTVPELRAALKNFEGTFTYNKMSKDNFVISLRDQYDLMDKGLTSPPLGILHSLHGISPKFAEKESTGTWQQQDADEFWLEMINILQETLPAYCSETEKVVFKSIIDQYFAGSLLLAESYILTGQPGKAFDICLKSAGADITHFLNAIRLFERHSRSDLVIAMATKALELLNVSPSDKETLESALFVHELGMGNFDAAWSWIESCTSWSRRSDFLHRLVSNMISEGKLTDLISFSYTGLLDELEKFLASRARSLPLAQAFNYYNILYAFHVKHENFKKAASVMFEKALRSDTAEMQWRCYGACLSSLMLVNDPSQAFLVRPNPFSQEDSIDILEVEDIQRKFELASARYTLDNCAPDATKEEVIAMCVTQKQFKLALRLANMCKLSCAPVIQEFTATCAALTEDAVTWHWLKNNEIDDFIVNEGNAIEMSWRILERCILKYEKNHEAILHRSCASQLLAIGYFLPTWLLKSYKKLNCSELLRLYLQNGNLEEASDLACEYLNAALGVGHEDFNIDAPLTIKSSPLCLPLHTIDILLLELKHYNLEENLEKTLNKYIDTVTRLTDEKPMLMPMRK